MVFGWYKYEKIQLKNRIIPTYIIQIYHSLQMSIPKLPTILLLLTLSILLQSAQPAYLPQLQLCSSTTFLNKELTKYGPTIEKQIDQAKIPDISFDDKIDGVHVQMNLTNLKQQLKINWNANVINIQNQHTFILNSKNINLTLDGHIQFKLGLTPKQKGQITIEVSKLQADTTLAFTQPHCDKPNSGLGFDIQIQKLFVNTQKIDIHITKKTLDNAVIKAILSLLKSRLPGIIEKNAIEKGNPAISKITCKPAQQLFPLGQYSYVAIINTTNVPHFVGKELYAALDVTFMNAVTNQTNDQLEDDALPELDLFNNKTEVSVLASSNMMNSILWLVDDSKVINQYVTNDMLGPNPPIQLNTLNLSILIPTLMKWPRKQVIVGVSTANRFSHLYIRNGKMIAVLSLSIKFIVNNTGQGQPVDQCIKNGHCIVACDLNATVPFSAAIHISQGSVLRGLVHTVAIEQLEKIESVIEVKTEGLKKILNTMIGSSRPQINQLIQTGIKLDLSKVQKYDVKEVLMLTKKDYAAIGVVFKN